MLPSKPNYLKLAFAAILALYFLYIAAKPMNGSFLDMVDLPIHEAGHIIFSPFGHFIAVAGGSLFQVLMPLVFFGYFIREAKYYSASIVLYWVGQSVTNVYVYAQDAVRMELVLLGGLTGSEGSFHDWNFLLTELGLINSTPRVAGLIRLLGTLCIIAAAVLAVRFSFSDEE